MTPAELIQRLLCPHPSRPHTALGEEPREWRDGVKGGLE